MFERLWLTGLSQVFLKFVFVKAWKEKVGLLLCGIYYKGIGNEVWSREARWGKEANLSYYSKSPY